MPADLVAARVIEATFARDLDLSESLVVLIALQALFFGTVVLLAGRFGAPPRWPASVVTLVAALGVGASIVWWWVDKDVEGTVLLVLSDTHGVTTGDLLSLPILLVVALVALMAAWGRRSPRERQDPT
jgi:hypothetical protein